MRTERVEANGVAFACLAEGPTDGPLALCLHGFPDTAHTFRHLLPVLADAGYRAVAPFLRGYAPTALAPDGNYQIGAVARDANALHEVLGADDEAVLIGHDWGALATYGAAGHQPERWRKAVTMAVPPIGATAERFFTFEALKGVWYTFFFQSPFAEMVVPLDDYRFLARLWAEWSPGYDAEWDCARVRESIGTPERTAAAIGYYRAMYDPSRHDPDLIGEQDAVMGTNPVPTLYLHGADDGCMAASVIGDPLAFFAAGSEVAVLPGAGHFLHLERPDDVNGRIAAFLAG